MNVVFDLGNVLIQWEPRRLYRQLFAGDEARVEWFLANVCNQAWNERHDAGRPFAEGVRELCAQHPEHEAEIAAYHARWPEMMGDAVPGTVEVLRELRDGGVPVYALSNWSAETFPLAEARFEFLTWFKGVVVSGREGMIKPDPAIYQLLLTRHALAAGECVFIDDTGKNVEAARAAGMEAIHFTGADALRARLGELGLLRASSGSAGL